MWKKIALKKYNIFPFKVVLKNRESFDKSTGIPLGLTIAKSRKKIYSTKGRICIYGKLITFFFEGGNTNHQYTNNI